MDAPSQHPQSSPSDQLSGRAFKIRVALVLPHPDRADSLLMVRQNGRPFWVFPGGTLEFGESLTECGVRELEEETGLIVTAGPLLYVSDFRTETRHVVDFFFAGCVVGGTLMDTPPLPENLDAISYISRDEFLGLLEQGLIQPQEPARNILTQWQAEFSNLQDHHADYGIYLQQ